MSKHKKLLKIANSKICLLLVFLSISGCTEKKEIKDYRAKVDEEVLTDKEIIQALDLERYGNYHKSEFVHNWIEKELLYREALDAEIDKDSNIIRLIEDLKKELLGSLVLNKYLEETAVVPAQNEIENYFVQYKDNFIIQDDAFVLNKITFTDKNKAVLFRNTLAGSNWKKALAVFSGDESIIDEKRDLLFYQYQLTPIQLTRVVKNLEPKEYSIVFETDPGKFSIVQLNAKLKKGTVPEFEEIADIVQKRYLISKRNEIVKKYISELYNKYNVEIKR